MKESLLWTINLIRHLDKELEGLSQSLGNWMYVVLFAVVFCETGLIVTPFLPGDSLLFAVGALIALPGAGLSFPLMFVLLTVAAVLGMRLTTVSDGRLARRSSEVKNRGCSTEIIC